MSLRHDIAGIFFVMFLRFFRYTVSLRMVNGKKVVRILAAKAKVTWREYKEDLFPMAILPMLIGSILLAFDDMGHTLYAKLRKALAPSFVRTHLEFAVFLAALALVAVSLPRLMKELFGQGRDEHYLRMQPVKPSEYYLAFLFLTMIRNIGTGALAGLLIYFIRADFLNLEPNRMASFSAGFLFVLILTPLQMLSVIVLTAARCARPRSIVTVFGSLSALAFLVHLYEADRYNPLLYPFFIFQIFTRPGNEISSWSQAQIFLIGAGACLLISIIAGIAFWLWPDFEGRSREIPNRSALAWLDWMWQHLRATHRLLQPKRYALIRRDLTLVARIFHRGIFLNYSFAFLFLGLMVYLIYRFQVHRGFDLFVLALISGALSSFSLSLITAWLLKYQIRFLWIDKSSTLDPADLWIGKVCVANVLSVSMVPGLILIVLAIYPKPPFTELSLIFFVSVLVSVVVASFTGGLIYEFERHPAIGLLFSFMASIPLTVFAVATYWWLLLLVFPVAMHYFKKHGLSRVRIILQHD